MLDTASIPDHPAAQVLAARQLAVLDRLVEIGMIHAEALARQAQIAMQEDPARPTGARELAHCRVARCVRLTIGLQTRILQGEPRAAETLAQRKALSRARRHQAAAAIEDLIAAEASGPEDREVLTASLERHLEYDRPDDYLDRPIDEIVAIICRGLGLPCDWNRWTASDEAARDIPVPAQAEADAPPQLKRSSDDSPPTGSQRRPTPPPALEGPPAPRRWPPPHRNAA